LQADALEKHCASWIGAEIIKVRLSFKIDHAFSPLIVGLLHPFKGVVGVVETGVNYRDATGSDLISFCPLFQFIQYLLCFVPVTRHRIGVSEPDYPWTCR